MGKPQVAKKEIREMVKIGCKMKRIALADMGFNVEVA